VKPVAFSREQLNEYKKGFVRRSEMGIEEEKFSEVERLIKTIEAKDRMIEVREEAARDLDCKLQEVRGALNIAKLLIESHKVEKQVAAILKLSS
jgi:hypothetical protein